MTAPFLLVLVLVELERTGKSFEALTAMVVHLFFLTCLGKYLAAILTLKRSSMATAQRDLSVVTSKPGQQRGIYMAH
jgi:hypothetical protein